ncbi:MAG: CcmD family protein [Chloroflexi bacterium]|nr:CcmD family protein [Chloroflexota bacterium]
MGNLTYLFMAYTIIWVVLFVYIAGLYRAQRQLRRDIDALKDLSRAREEDKPRIQVGSRRFPSS